MGKIKLKSKNIHLVTISFRVDLNRFDEAPDSIKGAVTGTRADDAEPDIDALMCLLAEAEDNVLVTCKQERAVLVATTKVAPAPVPAGPLQEGHCAFCRMLLSPTSGACINVSCEAYVKETVESLKSRMIAAQEAMNALAQRDEEIEEVELVEEEVESNVGS